jgi:predicted Zn-dependent protease
MFSEEVVYMRSIAFTRKWAKGVLISTLLCFTTVFILPARNVSAFSLSEEKELGRKMVEQLGKQLPLVQDSEIVSYVQSVGDRIAKQVGTTPYQFRFFVVNESVPNAFAIPGGYVFVYRGLIELMHSEGELAGVISHEMAHVQLHHIERRMDNMSISNIAALAGMLAGILLGVAGGGGDSTGNLGQALSMGSLAGAQTQALQYSRENEAEADQHGLHYLVAAGYPAKDMLSAMQRLKEGTWMLSSKIPSYLMTHPAIGERIIYLRDLVEQQNKPHQKPRYVDNVDDFAVMQAALLAEYGDPVAAQNRFITEGKQKKVSAIYGLGLLYLRAGKVAEALPFLKQAARMEAGSAFVLTTLGAAYYEQGKLNDALRVLESAIAISPSSSFAHLRLAIVLQELGRTNEALEQLRSIESFAPVIPDIDYRLGILLGQINELGEAHFHLARYYKQKHNMELAIFHYKKAKALLTGSPQKAQEVARELKELEKKKKKARWNGEEEK